MQTYGFAAACARHFAQHKKVLYKKINIYIQQLKQSLIAHCLKPIWKWNIQSTKFAPTCLKTLVIYCRWPETLKGSFSSYILQTPITSLFAFSLKPESCVLNKRIFPDYCKLFQLFLQSQVSKFTIPIRK